MFISVTSYRVLRTIADGPDGPVEEVLPQRLGAEPVARRRVAASAGPARHRLRQRAEALARSGHPGLAVTVDVVDVDEHHVDVVRTLGAATLAERLAAGTCSARTAERIAADLAAAVRAMHAAGVTHGRIHARNVLLAGDHALLVDPDLAAEPGTHTPADDLDALARLLEELRAHRATEGLPVSVTGATEGLPVSERVDPAETVLPHWTDWRPAPAPATPAALALPERALAGALAFGLGTAMGVTFVLAQALTGRG